MTLLRIETQVSAYSRTIMDKTNQQYAYHQLTITLREIK